MVQAGPIPLVVEVLAGTCVIVIWFGCAISYQSTTTINLLINKLEFFLYLNEKFVYDFVVVVVYTIVAICCFG